MNLSSSPGLDEQDLAPMQVDLEQSLGPECDIEGRDEPVCSQCGRHKPVHQRDIAGQPICRDCHDHHYQAQVERRVEHAKRDKALERKLREWDRWKEGDPEIRRSGD